MLPSASGKKKKTTGCRSGGSAVQGVGLKLFDFCDSGFVCRRGRGCLSLVSVVCCQVEVPASGRLLAQRSPTEYDRETATVGRPWRATGCCALEKKGYMFRLKWIAVIFILL